KMVGQPIIMIVMLTLGLDIFLRGLAPGLLGTTPKHLDLGIDIAPVVWGDVFVNRAYLLGGVIALVLIAFVLLFFRTRLGTKLRAGPSASRWGGPWPCRGGWRASARWRPARSGARSRAWTGPSPACCSRPWRW